MIGGIISGCANTPSAVAKRYIATLAAMEAIEAEVKLAIQEELSKVEAVAVARQRTERELETHERWRRPSGLAPNYWELERRWREERSRLEEEVLELREKEMKLRGELHVARGNATDRKKLDMLYKRLKRLVTPIYFDYFVIEESGRDFSSFGNVNSLSQAIDGNTAVVTVIFDCGEIRKIDLVRIDKRWRIAPPREILERRRILEAIFGN